MQRGPIAVPTRVGHARVGAAVRERGRREVERDLAPRVRREPHVFLDGGEDHPGGARELSEHAKASRRIALERHDGDRRREAHFAFAAPDGVRLVVAQRLVRQREEAHPHRARGGTAHLVRVEAQEHLRRDVVRAGREEQHPHESADANEESHATMFHAFRERTQGRTPDETRIARRS